MTPALATTVGSAPVAAAPTRPASPLIRLHANDNVLIARQPLGLGQELAEFGLRMRAQVPAGHKIAARRIAAGEQVKKYDTVIGAAMRDIEAGEHVHYAQPGRWSTSTATRVSARTCGRSTTCPKPSARRSWASCAPTAAWRRATSSAPVVGELLGDGDQAHRRALHARAAGGLPERRRRRCLRADQRLRHVVAERALRRSAPHASPAMRATRTWPAC